MTQQASDYLSKNMRHNPFPMSQELGISVHDARQAIAEYAGMEKPKKAPATDRHTSRPKGKAHEEANSVHDYVSGHPVAIICIRIISLVIGFACLARAFYLIVDYNGGFSDFRALLMPFIFQGLSLVLPLLAYVELQKKSWKRYPTFALLTLLSLASMTYEFRVSMEGFLSASYANVKAVGNEDEQIQTLQAQIQSTKELIANEQTLLQKRSEEFKSMAQDNPSYISTQFRINTIIRDIARYNNDNKVLYEQVIQLQKSKPKEVKRHTLSELLGLDDKLYTTVIIIMQSLLLIFATPICLGVSLLFGKRQA